MEHSTYLIHYASPYYDPQKAHEYYMKNRELKGTTRKGTLNEQGKKAKAYVKAQIDQERDTKLAEEDTSRTNQLEQNQASKKSLLEKNVEERDKEISDYAESVNKKVEALYEKLQSLPKETLAQNQTAIRNAINRFKTYNATKKQEITEAYSVKSNQITSEHYAQTATIRENSSNTKKTIRQDAKDKYNAELDKIYADSSMLKTKGSKSGDTSGKNYRSYTDVKK